MCVCMCVLSFAPVSRVFTYARHRMYRVNESGRIRCVAKGDRTGLFPPRKEVECINISRAHTAKTRDGRGAIVGELLNLLVFTPPQREEHKGQMAELFGGGRGRDRSALCGIYDY